MTTEPAEVRVIRKQLNEWCLKDASLSAPVKSRLLAFAESVSKTALDLANASLSEGGNATMEPLDRDLVEQYADLERTVKEIIPRLLEYRNTWKSRLTQVFEESQKATASSVRVVSKWNQDESEVVNSAFSVTDEQVAKAKEDVKEINRLESIIVPTLPIYLDRAEMNITALRNVPTKEATENTAAAEDVVTLPQDLLGAKSLANSLTEKMDQERKRLREASGI